MKFWTVLLACCAAYTAYSLASMSLPDGASHPWTMRILYTVSAGSLSLVKSGSELGLWDRWSTTRSVENWISVNLGPKRDPSLQVTDTYFDGVRVRVYVPKGDKKRRGIVYYHGGGWTIGNLESHDVVTSRLAANGDMVVVAVDYRLAPEHPFPAPLEDCVKATKYFLDNALKYNVDPNRVAVMGDSAGGNLASAVPLKLRGSKPSIKLQVLLYPTLQAIDMLLPSFQYAKDHLCTRHILCEIILVYAVGDKWNENDVQEILANNHTSPEIKKRFYSTYLSHSHLPKDAFEGGYKKNKDDFGNVELWKRLEGALLNPHFSPLLAKDLSGLPEAYILTCNVDILRDDGFLYAKRLRDAKVKVTHNNAIAGVHGMFSIFPDVDASKEAMSDLVVYLKKNL